MKINAVQLTRANRFDDCGKDALGGKKCSSRKVAAVALVFYPHFRCWKKKKVDVSLTSIQSAVDTESWVAILALPSTFVIVVESVAVDFP